MIKIFQSLILIATLVNTRVAFGVDEVRTNPDKFKNSRLTRVETEKKADRTGFDLAVGEDRVLDIDFDVAGHDAISEGNPKVISTQLVKIGDRRQLVFKPKAPGRTTVSVRDGDGNVRLIVDVKVSDTNLARISAEIRTLSRDIEGVEVKIVGQNIVVDGELMVPNDYGRLMSILMAEPYKKYVLSLATISPLALQTIAKKMEEEIKSIIPDIKVRIVNGLFILEGNSDSEASVRRAKEIAIMFLPEVMPKSALELREDVKRLNNRNDVVKSYITFTPKPPQRNDKLLRVTVHFVELVKNYENIFGFKWQPGFTTDTQVTVGTNAAGAVAGQAAQSGGFTATIGSLIPKLKSAQNAGYARVLRTGTVITKNGQNAKLEATEEFAFSVVAPNGQLNAQSKAVGLVVALTPQILSPGEDISMDMQLRQSTLTGKNTNGAPTTANHNVDTKIFVKSGESAAVAGMVTSDNFTDFNKDDPGKGSFEQNTEPLFSLLRSKGYRKKKSQFVIFVTPQIIDNPSEGTDDLKKNLRVKVK